MAKEMIVGNGIKRTFPVPGGEFQALKGIDVEIGEGVFAILRGRSGSGKTTLMNILSTLDDGAEGEVILDGINIKDLSAFEKEELRRKKMGFVFQSVSLIPSLNAYQNVEFALRMAGEPINKEAAVRIEECLKKVGLGNRMTHYPSEMSGGEQQRVAIARALINQPKILLADEPTSALDVTTQAQIVRQMMALRDDYKTSIIVVTHNLGVAAYMSDYIVVLKHGRIEDQGTREHILHESTNEYTRKLIAAVPSLGGERYV